MKNTTKGYWEQFDEEIDMFLFLCGKEDIGFLDVPKKKRKIEDYVRLTCINAVLGLKKVIVKLVGEAGSRFDEFLEYLNKIKGDMAVIDGWMHDFIGKIHEPELQQIISEFWAARRKEVSSDDFNIGQFLA